MEKSGMARDPGSVGGLSLSLLCEGFSHTSTDTNKFCGGHFLRVGTPVWDQGTSRDRGGHRCLQAWRGLSNGRGEENFQGNLVRSAKMSNFESWLYEYYPAKTRLRSRLAMSLFSCWGLKSPSDTTAADKIAAKTARAEHETSGARGGVGRGARRRARRGHFGRAGHRCLRPGYIFEGGGGLQQGDI